MNYEFRIKKYLDKEWRVNEGEEVKREGVFYFVGDRNVLTKKMKIFIL